MDDEKVLCESRTLRGTLASRTDVLDRVKALAVLPDGLHVTTEMVAAYFVIHREAIKSVARRHREELTENDMEVLRGSDLREFKRVNLTPLAESYPQPPANLTLYTRRTVLNIAMLLRDSEVAREVGRYLLEVEEAARGGALEPRVRNLAAMSRQLADIASDVKEIRYRPHRLPRRSG